VRCLFLAPLKPPDDPVPSGDRTIARGLMAALGQAGFAVELASRLRMRLAVGDAAELAGLQAAAAEERARLRAAEARRPRPAMVFAYHVYHRSPDLIGPALAAGLGVPYVVAEAARSPRHATSSFAEGYRLAARAIDAAALVFAATSNDRVVLDRMRPAGQRIVDLYPFLDLAAWPALPRPPSAGPVRLLAVAMMRAGDKAESYAQLAAALGGLDGWRLDIVGDGPAGAEVRALFAGFGARVRFHGEVAQAALPAIYAAADLLVWPAVNEAFGMVFLEAQSQSVPCIAAGHGSVADAVLDGRTGRVVLPGDIAGFRAVLAEAISDPALRARWAAAARPFVAERRSLAAAVPVLRAALAEVVG
jgi:glycosyltransferase involved in cell wall biosynthesis